MTSEQRSGQAAAATYRVIAIIPAGIALNLVLGTLVATLKIPLYLDAVGTIVVTVLAGLRVGLAVGVVSFLLAGVLTNPVLPWFAGTQAVIALCVYLSARRGWLAVRISRADKESWLGWLARNARPIAVGIGLGIVAGLASAPVIVALFGGITGSGPSLVVAFLLKSGQTLYDAVLISGLASEPIDKTLQLLLSLGLIRSLPNSLKAAFGGQLLARNNLLSFPMDDHGS